MSARGTLFTVYKEDALRFGAAVVVSKKVAKLATERNALRRRVYAAVSTLPVQKGLYVIIVSPAARSASFEQLKDAVAVALG